MKTTKRALLTSVVALILCFSMLVGTTFAWFTDEVKSGVNQIVAGNLDVEVYYGDPANKDSIQDVETLFNDVTLWEPGAVAYENLTVVNEGTLALKYQLSVNFTNENTVNGYGLSQVLQVAVVEDGFSGTREEAMALNGTALADFMLPGELGATESKTYGIVIWWEPSADDNNWNVNNGKTTSDGEKYLHIDLGVKLFATQLAADIEQDSFGPDYDKDAWHPEMQVATAADLQAALNNGETNITLIDDIETDEPIIIPASAPAMRSVSNGVVIDLNGKTLTGTTGRDAEGNRVHVLVNNGNLVLTNGTVESAGKNGGSAIYNAAGATLVLENITVLGAPKDGSSWPSYGINNYGYMVVEDATVKTYHGGIATADGAETIINYANVDVGQGTATAITSYTLYTYGTAKLTVNGGIFANTASDAKGTGGAIVCQSGDNAIIITGGSFSGGCGLYGDFVISGGTFDRDVKNLVAEGYKSVDNGDGTWTVLFPQESFEDLFENAQPGDTVNVPAGSFTLSGNNQFVIVGSGEDTVITFTGSIENVKVSNATIIGEPRLAVKVGQNVEFNNVSFEGTKAWGSIHGTASFTGCTFTGLFHIDSSAETTTIKFNDCTFDAYSVIKLGGSADYILDNCTVEQLAADATGAWGKEWLITYCDTTLENCKLGRVIRAGAKININLNNCVDAEGAAVTQAIVHTYNDPYIWINKVAQARTAEGLQSIMDAATEDITIQLAPGKWGTIVMKSGVTLVGGEGVVVDCVNLNGANNVTLKDITFDAAGAQMAYDGNGNPRFLSSILSGAANKNGKGTRNLLIEGCTFEGEFANGGTVIAFNDQNRGSGQSGNITIRGCTFKTTGAYVDIYTYYSGYGEMIIEGNTFASVLLDRPIYLGKYQSNTAIVVKGNHFENEATLEEAALLQPHSAVYTPYFIDENNTFGG